MNEKTIWKGSRGPLFIRSVWMGNENYRHFILDNKNNHYDSSDKKKVCRQNSKARNLRHTKSFMLEHEFENLQLIGSSDIGCPRTKEHHDCNFKERALDGKKCDGKKFPRCRLSFETLRRQIHQNVDNKLNGNNIRKTSLSNNGNNGSDLGSNLIHQPNEELNLKLNSTINSPKLNKLSETTKNQLTERVLNWLDLAGKNTLIRPETALPCLTTHHHRHQTNSIGNKNNYKYDSNNNNDGSCDNLKEIIIPKRRILTTDSIIRKQPLRRAESVHHLSLTLNEDDLDLYSNRRFFEASSRCTSALKFGEFFPTTYRCSRKLLQSSQAFRNNRHFNLASFPSLNEMTSTANSSTANINSTASSIHNNPITVTHHKMKKSNLKKIDPNIEKEYKSIIHRQILENSCNQQIAKRQLHIFMPNLPNKAKMLTAAGQDCDSCLSTIVGSEVSHVNK